MPCPFPGMDPYIERPDLWPDFHDSLVPIIRGILQPLLRPRYAAVVQDRLYVVESDRPIRPDVSLVPVLGAHGTAPAATAVLPADTATVFEFWREEIREPLITIVEPAAGNRVITGIEVLSPDNKRSGPGRDAYLKKREEFWASGTNLVEIDLLRHGDPTVRIAKQKLESLGPWTYLAAVTRRWPSRQEVYPVPLKHRLSRIAVPLSENDKDVTLDLQLAFTRCWDEGPYPGLLRYDGPPPGTMPADDVSWCEDQLRAAGFRTDA